MIAKHIYTCKEAFIFLQRKKEILTGISFHLNDLYEFISGPYNWPQCKKQHLLQRLPAYYIPCNSYSRWPVEKEKKMVLRSTNTYETLFLAWLLLAFPHFGHLKLEKKKTTTNQPRLERNGAEWEDEKTSFQDPQQTHTNGGYDSTQRKQRREVDRRI